MKHKTLSEISRVGASGFASPELVALEGVRCGDMFPDQRLRYSVGLPELSEVEVVRHFTRLSYDSHGVDNGPFPLGSCTMKYNPKRHDELAQLEGFSHAHPRQPAESLAGVWEFMAHLQECLAEITGMDAFTLQPAAGAHGELTGLLVIRKHYEVKGERRGVILIPDSAHGTNPASAAMAGYVCRIIPTRRDGMMDVEAMKRELTPEVAALMLTNPSTLGLFEENIVTIADLLHANGSLLYYDGANFNALMGIVRPGDMGFDVIHVNTHKTFSTPHGGGGPGAGPCGVKKFLEPYLPVPVVMRREGRVVAEYDRPQSIGKMKAHFGHVEVLLRAYAYLLTNGAAGLRMATENAVLNASYVAATLNDLVPAVFPGRGMHEVLLSGEHLKVNAFDFVKRLIDFRIHPPTLVGAGCVHFASEYNTTMLVEPTETETRDSLDQMVARFRDVAMESTLAPYMVETAPHNAGVFKIVKDQVAYINNLRASLDDPGAVGAGSSKPTA